MTMTDQTQTRWGIYIEKRMDAIGWKNVDLARASGIDRSLIGRWRNEDTVPAIESVRSVAHAFGRDIREALIEAELFTEDEMQARTITPDIRLISDEELTEEVRRRMSTGRSDQ